MPASSKKVILRTLANAVYPGYLPPSGLLDQSGEHPTVPLLDLDGRVQSIALAGIRYIAFVRDFNRGDAIDPERLSRRTFIARPRAEGLWMRLTFTDGDTLDGLAASDLALADGLLEDRGFFLIPPDIRSNTQRLYVPRSSVTRCDLLAVITNPSKQKPVAATARGQESLFPESSPASPEQPANAAGRTQNE